MGGVGNDAPAYSKEVSMFLMFLILVAFLATVGVLAWFGCQRVALHLRGNPDATKAVVEHVLIPLFGRKQETEYETWPDGTLKACDAPSGEQENDS
jgi:hypothetical protein